MTPEILCYHILKDGLWLHHDEKSWTPNYHEAAGYALPEVANDIAKRESEPHAAYYIMACLQKIDD